jgi:hypothetical protein
VGRGGGGVRSHWWRRFVDGATAAVTSEELSSLPSSAPSPDLPHSPRAGERPFKNASNSDAAPDASARECSNFWTAEGDGERMSGSTGGLEDAVERGDGEESLALRSAAMRFASPTVRSEMETRMWLAKTGIWLCTEASQVWQSMAVSALQYTSASFFSQRSHWNSSWECMKRKQN